MQYSFTCPIEGCGQKLTVDAASHEEATEKMTDTAKGHVATVHPDLSKTDEQVREDVNSIMVEEDSTSPESPSGSTVS